MAVSLKHGTEATVEDSGNGEIGKAQWNEEHALTGTPDTVLGFDSNGDATEVLLEAPQVGDVKITGRALSSPWIDANASANVADHPNLAALLDENDKEIGTIVASTGTGVTNTTLRRSASNEDASIICACSYDGNVYVSFDGGATYSRNAIPIAPASQMYTVTYGNGVFIVSGQSTSPNWFRSSDGVNWTAIPNQTGQGVDCMLYDGTYWYVFQSTGNLVWRSVDNGSSWTSLTPNLTLPYVSAGHAENGTLVVAAGGGAYLSTDSGVTWSLRVGSVVTGYINQLVKDEFTGYYYVQGENNADGDISRSVDGGLSWAQIPTPTMPDGAYSLAARNGLLVMGTADAEVYYTTNDGGAWTQVATPWAVASGQIRWFTIAGDRIIMTGDGVVKGYVPLEDGLTFTPANAFRGLPADNTYILADTV